MYFSNVMLEVRTYYTDGRTYVQHHDMNPVITEATLRRIKNRQHTCDGASLEQVAELQERYKTTDKNQSHPIIAHNVYGSGMYIAIHLDLIDILGRVHSKWHQIYIGNDENEERAYQRGQSLQKVELEQHAKRKNRQLKLSGVLAHIISTNADNYTHELIVTKLAKSIDRAADENDDHSKISIVKANVRIDEDLTIRATKSVISIEEYRLNDQATIRGNSIHIKGTLPATVLAQLPGKKLGDVVSGLPEYDDIRVLKGSCVSGRIMIVLDMKSVISDFQFEGKKDG